MLTPLLEALIRIPVVQAAPETVAAGLGDHVDHSSGSPPVFGFKAGSVKRHFLDRLQT